MTLQEEKENPALYSRFVKGKTDTIHVHLTKESKLAAKVSSKAGILGMSINEWVVRLLILNTNDISIDGLRDDKKLDIQKSKRRSN